MTFMRARVRAFPRFPTGIPAVLQVGGVAQTSQIIDVSQGGCKVLPLKVEPLLGEELVPGTPLTLVTGTMRFLARLIWTTPNCSALGCRFEEPLANDEIWSLLSIAPAGATPVVLSSGIV
ncbi:MAG: PilZ domain-containing protein [Magnetospirillum sp.]|nr:PilZ domain-containing protein [Magnetospirillum sp.]